MMTFTTPRTTNGADNIILSVRDLHKSFKTPEGNDLLVLDNITLELHEGEIVALLGRSGSGKSTLLRSLIGLISPSSGTVRYRNRPVIGPMPGMAMVFQSFALFPWLTVLENVELGLEAQGVPEGERRRRALDVIDLIGLDGFESAYPKELSGGMRQRVGFARALVTNPDVLLMDEPFSALDVLTAENLRAELLNLWGQRRIPTRSILVVTHNIEEAVLMADRVLILSSNPGRLVSSERIDLPRPRDREDPAFRAVIETIYHTMTTPVRLPGAAEDVAFDHTSLGMRLPQAEIAQLIGLIERVDTGPDRGRDDLPTLADEMQLDVDDLFPLTDAAELLGFAQTRAGDITLLPEGVKLARSNIQERKQIFAEHLASQVALVAHIRRVLANRPDHRAPRERFLSELEDYMSEEDAAYTLDIAIDWGRYAELFEYDARESRLRLPENGA
ncbi:MAG: AAA-associated domain-containing protein [Oscillochloridaceae bacterium umkhey_bin13]